MSFSSFSKSRKESSLNYGNGKSKIAREEIRCALQPRTRGTQKSPRFIFDEHSPKNTLNAIKGTCMASTPKVGTTEAHGTPLSPGIKTEKLGQ
jgi:hypothetical protein